jgi:hypothetical protein
MAGLRSVEVEVGVSTAAIAVDDSSSMVTSRLADPMPTKPDLAVRSRRCQELVTEVLDMVVEQVSAQQRSAKVHARIWVPISMQSLPCRPSGGDLGSVPRCM